MSIFKNKCFNFIGKHNRKLNIESKNKNIKTNLKIEKDIDDILECYVDYYEEVNELYLKIDI